MHSDGITICSRNICMFSTVISSVSMHVSTKDIDYSLPGLHPVMLRCRLPVVTAALQRASAVDLTVESIWTQRVCAAESRPFPKVNEPIVNQITSCDRPAMIRDLHTYRQRERKRERESWGRGVEKSELNINVCVLSLSLSHTHQSNYRIWGNRCDHLRADL